MRCAGTYRTSYLCTLRPQSPTNHFLKAALFADRASKASNYLELHLKRGMTGAEVTQYLLQTFAGFGEWIDIKMASNHTYKVLSGHMLPEQEEPESLRVHAVVARRVLDTLYRLSEITPQKRNDMEPILNSLERFYALG